jgi:SnoaL-like domain
MRWTGDAANSANARQIIALETGRNIDTIQEQYAEDARFLSPNMEVPLRGRAAIRSFFVRGFAGFRAWTVDVSRVHVKGGDVVVVNSVRGSPGGRLVRPCGPPVRPTSGKFVREPMTRVVLKPGGEVPSLR